VARRSLSEIGVIGCTDCLDWAHRVEVLQERVEMLTKENVELDRRCENIRQQYLALRSLGLWRPEVMDG